MLIQTVVQGGRTGLSGTGYEKIGPGMMHNSFNNADCLPVLGSFASGNLRWGPLDRSGLYFSAKLEPQPVRRTLQKNQTLGTAA